MKTTRTLALITMVVLWSLAVFAQKHDPKIIIHGTSGGGAPTVCLPDVCMQVGLNFTFSVNHNGGKPLEFNNASGQNWTSLTLVETGVAAGDVKCVQNVYFNCTATTLDNGSTQIFLSGLNGLNPHNGILAGMNFSIGFGCIQRVCWPKGLSFSAQAGTGFTTVDFPGAVSTVLYGINNAGQMVGAYTDGNQATHGFLLGNGVFTTIDYPGATLSVAAGINNQGVITGQYNDSEGFGHGFVFSGNEFGTRDFPGYQTYPTAIDDAGDLVGFCVDSGLVFHGCVEYGDSFTLLDYPGATASVALGISSNGASIAGGYGTVNGDNFEHGYLEQDGEFTPIDFPGHPSVAFGVNVPGEIVGDYWTPPSFDQNGFSLISGTFTTTNIPGALQTNPVNLNDLGQVVGWYVDASNVTHGYVRGN